MFSRLHRHSLALFLLTALFLLGGCASFQATHEHGRSLAKVQRFFVVSNLNDNHAIDTQIATSLQAHGLRADTGPLTMMPENTQAVVTFQDHWTWDFSDHLVFLSLSVRDIESTQPYATATFSAKVPLRDPFPDIVDRLVSTLLSQ